MNSPPHSIIERYSKFGLLIYNTEFLDTAGKNTRRSKRKRTQAITKRYAFHANENITFCYMACYSD